MRRRSARGITYEEIHDITKIDVWFIDKIAILVEMEQALKTQELTAELLKEAKRHGVPGQCHCPPHRKERGGDQESAL